MALIKKFDSSDLYDLAVAWGRADSFGRNGWNAIGEYLEQLSDDMGEDVEVDIIGICCEYSSADDAGDWWSQYGEHSSIDAGEWEEMDEEEKLQAIRDYLEEKTSVVVCDEDCIIWQAF